MKHLVLVGVCLLAVAPLMAEPPATIAGNYVEVRSNEVYTCACLYSGEMVTSGRDAILAWNIREGAYQGTSLAGTKVVAIVVAKQNLDFEEAGRISILYVDPAAAGAQQAILNLFSNRYGKLLGEITAVRQAPINFRFDGETAEVKIADTVLAVHKAQLPADAHPGSSQWYTPFVPLKETHLATSTRYEFQGKGFNQTWSRVYPPTIAGFYGTFELAAR